MRILILTLAVLGILGFVYVDAVPLRKSLRDANLQAKLQRPNQIADQAKGNQLQFQGYQQDLSVNQNQQQFQGQQQMGLNPVQQQQPTQQQFQAGVNQQPVQQQQQQQAPQQFPASPNQLQFANQQQQQLYPQQQQQYQLNPNLQQPNQQQVGAPAINNINPIQPNNAFPTPLQANGGQNPFLQHAAPDGTKTADGPGDGFRAQNANIPMVGGVQQLGRVAGPAQVQQPAGDGTKPNNVVFAPQQAGDQQQQQMDMPAGGAPNAGVRAEVKAPPPAQAGEEQLPQPEPLEANIRLAKVPQHRDQQIEQPRVEDDNKHPIKKATFLDTHKTLKVKDIQPPDHLDAVRLEQDGHLNRDYKKEIFLGNHEDIEQGSEKDIKKKLTDIFHKVDANSDGFIVSDELEAWITLKVDEHFAEAIQENEHVFTALDTDQDGDITWREFHIQFLMAKGHDQKQAEKHMEDYETIPLDPEDKEQLIRFKFRWAEADEDPQDNKLTLSEFKNFRHPEQSENMLMRMVMDIIENLDKDRDNIITEEEFAALPPGEVDEQWKESDRMWQDERKKEFREVMDLNGDHRVTKEELKKYVDPKNPQHSKLEAANLIELADGNKDNKISLAEMLENTELFLGSKVVNTGRSFHDEF